MSFRNKIGQNHLKELLDYNPKTGVFVWKESLSSRVSVGDLAGTLSNGYVEISIYKRRYKAHRLAWFYTYGYWPENYIDHINRDKTDNRIRNLREVSNQCNSRNSSKPNTNTSGVKGVTWSEAACKWRSQIVINDTCHYLGLHVDFTEAVAHRLAAEQCLGWLDCDSSSSAYNYIKDKINGIS